MTPSRPEGAAPDLYAATRMFTGRPMHRGYVMSRSTARVVAACPHLHRTRRRPTYVSGAAFAMRCAKRMLVELSR